MSRSRNWCFTVNNWTTEHVQKLLQLSQTARVRCIMYGKEVGESGTPHLQGFTVLTMKASLATMKRLGFPGHLEIMVGKVEHNVIYCSKDGDVTVHGDVPKSQQQKGEMNKERWDDALKAAKEGRMDDIPADIYLRHYGTIKKIRDDSRPKPSMLSELDNMWIYGPTGTGKSRYVADKHPDAYWKLLNKWWDGYDGEDVVVMEDMDPFNKALGGDVKRWADHYPFRAEYKGGSKMIRPKKIIITSNYTPEQIWTDNNTVDPIRRRFKFHHFTEAWGGLMQAGGASPPPRPSGSEA